ncbi:MAG: CvpA family protein [Clostridia bacterium]|nr:CvpA family protein [Clostridia bacterium]
MILDLVCTAVIIALGVVGLVRGFAKLVLGLFNGLVAVVGAYFLFMPVYNLLYSLFLGNVVESLGASMAGITFLDSYAQTVGKTTGVLLAEYIAMFVVYVVLSFAIGLTWKLLKKLICKIFELPVLNIVNKIAGTLLGIFFGFVIVFTVLYVWNLIGTLSFVSEEARVSVLNALNQASQGSVIIKPFIIDNFAVFTEFFSKIIELILSGFNTTMENI